MSDADTLAADLDRRCLDGLAAVAAALAGGDPGPVCRSFAAWKRLEARRSWPWLPGLCWTALDWLGAAFPVDDDAAVTLGRFVIGAETDAERVRAALATARRTAGRHAAAASGPDLSVELRRQTLEAAVDRFWDELRRAAARLREPVVAGDRAAADAVVVAARRRLEEIASRIDAHARTLTEALPEGETAPVVPPAAAPAKPPGTEPPAAAPADADTEPAPHAPQAEPDTPPADVAREPPGVGPEPDGPEPTGRLTVARPAGGARGPGPPGSRGVRGGPAARERDGDDVEYRQIREHRLAPVLFLVAVTLVALIWLLLIGSR